MDTKTRTSFLALIVMLTVGMVLVVGTGCDFDDFGYYDYAFDTYDYYDAGYDNSGFDAWANDAISTVASEFVYYD